MVSDNMSSIRGARDEAASSANKFLDVKFLVVQEALRTGDLSSLNHCPGAELGADGLTKHLGRVLFQSFMDRLGVYELITTTDGLRRPAGFGFGTDNSANLKTS